MGIIKQTPQTLQGAVLYVLPCVKFRLRPVQVWHRPVYILSSLERARSVRRLLEVLGLSKEVLQRVHICGADGILFGTDPDGSQPREVRTRVIHKQQLQSEALSFGKQQAGQRTVTPSALGEAEANAEGSAAAAVSAPPVASVNVIEGTAGERESREEGRNIEISSFLHNTQAANVGIAAKLNGALSLWEYHKTLGLRGVPQFFDDDIRTLEAAAADPRQA